MRVALTSNVRLFVRVAVGVTVRVLALVSERLIVRVSVSVCDLVAVLACCEIDPVLVLSAV